MKSEREISFFFRRFLRANRGRSPPEILKNLGNRASKGGMSTTAEHDECKRLQLRITILHQTILQLDYNLAAGPSGLKRLERFR